MSFDRYRALLERVDAHAARVAERHAARLHCRLGCTACCRQDLAVSRVEAEHILEWLVAHGGAPRPDPARTAVDAHALFDALAGPQPCTFLAAGGACGIYPVRPLICRTHGLPVQVAGPSTAESDDDRYDDDDDDDGPLVRDVCPLNLRGDEVTLETIEAVDVLDLDRLNTLLAMVDQLYCAEAGEEPVRVPLSALRAMFEG